MAPSPSSRARAAAATVVVLASCALTLALAEVLVRLLVDVRNVGPSFTTFDPYYGKALKKDFHTWRTAPEFRMELTTNALGYRGPDLGPHEDVAIAFVGDSFTMGYGMSDGREFPRLIEARLQERHPHLTVLNTGMGNNGNGRWVKALRRDIPRFSPELVVLAVMGNDFEDNLREGLFRLEDGALVEQPVERSFARRIQPAIEALWFPPRSHLFALALEALRRPADLRPEPGSPGDEPDRPDTSDELTFALVEESGRLVRALGAHGLFILIEIEGERRARLRRIADHLRFDAIVIPTKAERPDLYFETDGHWTAAGHRFVAERVAAHVEAHPELLSPAPND